VIYVRLRTSALGDDFPQERFVRTPISVIRWALRELDDRDQALANLHATPVAQLTQILIQIAHGFSGSKRPAPKMELKDFLPFPNWHPAGHQADGPDSATKFVLSELGKQRRIPIHVLTALLTTAERQP
jgi:hypothetical protein